MAAPTGGKGGEREAPRFYGRLLGNGYKPFVPRDARHTGHKPKL